MSYINITHVVPINALGKKKILIKLNCVNVTWIIYSQACYFFIFFSKFLLQCVPCMQGCSFYPVPRAMARVVFVSIKKIDERFQSNATFLFSKNKWKTWETDKSYLCLPQQVKRGGLNFKNFFLANSRLLRMGSQQLFSPQHITFLNFTNFQ